MCNTTRTLPKISKAINEHDSINVCGAIFSQIHIYAPSPHLRLGKNNTFMPKEL